MPVSATAGERADIVARLRSAGCVYAEAEAEILLASAPTQEDLAVFVDRRMSGLPLEQVVGWAEFCGMQINIEPGVFVPRRRTEFLVQEAIRRMPTQAIVIDLCCGSGALGVVLATQLAGVALYASDIDPTAVRCALGNIGDHGQVFEGDLFDPLPPTLRGRADLIVCCPPYVPSADLRLMPPEARRFEPEAALDGGVAGIDPALRVISDVPDWLAPGGCLLLEASEAQVPALTAAITAAGLEPSVSTDEDYEATVVVATLLK